MPLVLHSSHQGIHISFAATEAGTVRAIVVKRRCSQVGN